MFENPFKNFASLGLPQPVMWALAAVSLFATVWPSIHELFVSAIPWRRKYEREKLRLELLKLRCEIEVLKKEHQLNVIPDTGGLIDAVVAATPLVEPQQKTMTIKRRFCFGFAGSVLPSLWRFSAAVRTGVISFTIYYISAAVAGFFIMGIIAGVSTIMFTGRQSSARTCFLIGLSSAFTVQAIAGEAVRSQEVPRT